MSLKQTERKTTQNMYLYEIAVISSGSKIKNTLQERVLKAN